MFRNCFVLLFALTIALFSHVQAVPSKVIYITPNVPMVNCTIGVNSTGVDVIDKISDASGYEVSLIRYKGLYRCHTNSLSLL